MHWFTIGWWKYLLAKKAEDVSWKCVIKCRLRGHAGPIFYNTNGLEPDMTCSECGDDLG